MSVSRILMCMYLGMCLLRCWVEHSHLERLRAEKRCLCQLLRVRELVTAVVIEMEVMVTMEALVMWATQQAVAAFTRNEWRQHC